MRKSIIICIAILTSIATIFGVVVMHNNNIYYHPSLFVETFNSQFGGKIICVNDIYYQYKNSEQKGVFVYEEEEQKLLFKTEEIYSVVSLNNKLICLSQNNIYIYDIPNKRKTELTHSELKRIFDTIGLSQEIGFYDSFRLSTENNKVVLYCFATSNAFYAVKTLDIYPEISNKCRTYSITDNDFNSVEKNCFVLPFQINTNSSNCTMIATKAQGAGKVNFHTLPEINEILYTWNISNNYWKKLYYCQPNEKIIYADENTYIVYNHKNKEYKFVLHNGTITKIQKCKKLKPFGHYTYQICNEKIFILDKNYEVFDIINISKSC